MKAAGECIYKVAQCIITALHWLNVDLLAKLRMETRVSLVWHRNLALTAPPRQGMNLDAHCKLELLFGATGEVGELCLAGAEGTV